MIITIHRGTHEIGGSCIEVTTQTSRILIDAGSPLESDDTGKDAAMVPSSLAASLRKKSPPLSGVLISHPHMDHYGLLPKLPADLPVYAGQFASVLVKLSNELSNKPMKWKKPKAISDRAKLHVGDFSVTPYLMDHSGFDSYAFLIEAEGKRVFYTGDFRGHGRKSATFKRFLKQAPKNIDALIQEGTTIGRAHEPSMSEQDLEVKLVQSIKQTKGPVFITLAGQNIDRIVSAYKAAMANDRIFIIDPYLAEILDRIKKQYVANGQTCRLPQASWPKVKVCYPDRLCSWLKGKRLGSICRRHQNSKIEWDKLVKIQDNIVMLVRPSSFDEVRDNPLFDLSDALWIYSMWTGYLRDEMMTLFNDFKVAEAKIEIIHTSGHADTEALLSMVAALNPDMIIPVHTAYPDKYRELFPNVTVVNDGEQLPI